MRSQLGLALLLVALAGCGGGSSSVTTITGGGAGAGQLGPVVALDTPSGPNTTEIVVDSGPSGFALGVSNVAYVTVTVCSPGSVTNCATIDHVILDTGSIGFRVLKSAVAKLGLAPVVLPADAASTTPAGPAVECFAFVVGALWGPLAKADLRIGGELAEALPIQLIDDSNPPAYIAPKDCNDAAGTSGLLNSVSALQANGVLGVGMIKYDCGQECVTGNYAALVHPPYYACPSTPSSCVPAAVPAALQVQNPVAFFVTNGDGTKDDNGTIILLPATPEYGASVAKGRLVFGIGTQTNNQLQPTTEMLMVDSNPLSSTYLYLSAAVGGKTYTNSYIDSGSNALFFDDTSLPTRCQSSSGSSGGWYCPTATRAFSATLTAPSGPGAPVNFSVANADALFLVSNMAFSNLAGTAGQGVDTFVWGLPFFYGRAVYTSIWGQALSANGPWVAF